MRAFHLSDAEIRLIKEVRDLSTDDQDRIAALVTLLQPDSPANTPSRPPLALVS